MIIYIYGKYIFSHCVFFNNEYIKIKFAFLKVGSIGFTEYVDMDKILKEKEK